MMTNRGDSYYTLATMTMMMMVTLTWRRCRVPVLPLCLAKAAAQAEWMLLTQLSSST